MFIGVLSVCTLVSFSRSLPSNYEKPIKCVSVTNIPCQARPALDENLIKHSNKTLFMHLLLVLISLAEVVTLLMTNMREYVF